MIEHAACLPGQCREIGLGERRRQKGGHRGFGNWTALGAGLRKPLLGDADELPDYSRQRLPWRAGEEITRLEPLQGQEITRHEALAAGPLQRQSAQEAGQPIGDAGISRSPCGHRRLLTRQYHRGELNEHG